MGTENQVDLENIAEAIYRMLFVLAELRRDLEVYRGLFEKREDGDIVQASFREIGESMRLGISTRLILGSAALFVDKRTSCGKENFSIKALLDRCKSELSKSSKEIASQIDTIVTEMNIRDFRNQRLAHFDYDVLMGKAKIESVIKNDKLDELLSLTESLLHQLSIDVKYVDGSKSYFYSKIDPSRAPNVFLQRIAKKICETTKSKAQQGAARDADKLRP